MSGAMKWEKGTKNSNVVDARGGSITILGRVVYFDIQRQRQRRAAPLIAAGREMA